MLKKPFFTIAFIGWMVFVTFSSLYSFEGVGTPTFIIPHLDKAVHFIFYLVACILGMFFLRERTNGKMAFCKALFLMVFSTICFGVIIEAIQYLFTTDRMGDIFDGIANSLGALSGAGVVKFLFLPKGRLKWGF